MENSLMYATVYKPSGDWHSSEGEAKESEHLVGVFWKYSERVYTGVSQRRITLSICVFLLTTGMLNSLQTTLLVDSTADYDMVKNILSFIDVTWLVFFLSEDPSSQMTEEWEKKTTIT